MKQKKITVATEKKIYSRFLKLNNKTKVALEFGTSPRTVGRIVAKLTPKVSTPIKAVPVPETSGVKVAPTGEAPEEIQVGHLISGSKIKLPTTYSVTDDLTICEVIELVSGMIKVVVISTANPRNISQVGREFTVHPNFFNIIGRSENFVEASDKAVAKIATPKTPQELDNRSLNELLSEFKDVRVGDMLQLRSDIKYDQDFFNPDIKKLKGKEVQVLTASVEASKQVSVFHVTDGEFFQWVRLVDVESVVTDSSKTSTLYTEVNKPAPVPVVEAEVAEPVEPSKPPAYIMTGMSISLTIDETTSTMNFSDPSFKKVQELLLGAGDNPEYFKVAEGLMNKPKALTKWSQGLLAVENGAVTFKGLVIYNNLTQKILNMIAEGDEGFVKFAKFLNMTMLNPSYKARQQLLNFASAKDISISEEGYIVAFKNVTADFKDKHSGKFDNSVGQTVKMDRAEVDDNESHTCSNGLHVCSVYYLKSMWGTSGATVKVHVHPRDMVAVPNDYKNSKARVCRYQVIEDVSNDLQKYLDMV